MLNPFPLFLWLVVLAGVLTAVLVHFMVATNGVSVALADLTAIKPLAGELDRWLTIFRETIGVVGVELVLYGALVVIGVLLIVRAVMSAILVIRYRIPPARPGGQVRVEREIAHGLTGYRSLLGRGFTGKMLLAFTGTVGLFGFCTAAVVYITLMQSLREHQLKRATVLAQNVSDAAAGYVVRKEPEALRGLVRKLAGGQTTAYIVVEDRQGSVVAHSLAELPVELQSSQGREPLRQAQRRTLSLAAQPAVYEIVTPLLDGQAGAVRVGLWAQAVEAEIRRTVVPVVSWVLALVAAGMICAIYLVRRINRPIVRLVRVASVMSRGDLNMPLSGTRDAGEFGDLSRSLERLRSSVKAAMMRLD